MKTIQMLKQEGRPICSTTSQILFDTMSEEGKIYCQLENISIAKQYIIALINEISDLKAQLNKSREEDFKF